MHISNSSPLLFISRFLMMKMMTPLNLMVREEKTMAICLAARGKEAKRPTKGRQSLSATFN